MEMRSFSGYMREVIRTLQSEERPEAMAIIERYRNRDRSSSYLLYFA